MSTYWRSRYALVWGLVISRWVVAALGKSEFGLCGGVGGMTGIVMLANTMRLVCGRIAAASFSSMGTGSMGEKTTVVIYCGNYV